MELLLHYPDSSCNLADSYKRAFDKATELFMVSAFLTDWDDALKLNSDCRRFRLIVGKDFGITRKSACQKVMRWLPASQKHQFRVADRIVGFHPKAAFWLESDGRYFAIVGSSNLTEAAFGINFEANVFLEIDKSHFQEVKLWLNRIERLSIPVDEGWLQNYRESQIWSRTGIFNGRGKPKAQAVLPLDLPLPLSTTGLISERRKALGAFNAVRGEFRKLFRKCASGAIPSATFYSKLGEMWGPCRLQGHGWEIKGKQSDFQTLAKSFLRILDSTDDDRDEVVRAEIDDLATHGIPTRGAFLSEMLCLTFPGEYPVLNYPVWEFLKHKKYKTLRGASEGSSYLHLALTLRSSLAQNPEHPAKNLAELDTLIWRAYGKNSK
jgi:HKD family nuclease